MDIYKSNELPVYVCDAQVIDNINKVVFMKNFPHHQFIFCTEGEGILCSQTDIEIPVKKNSVIFIEKSAIFSLRPYNDILSLKRIAFNGEFSSYYLEYFGFGVISVLNTCDQEVLYLLDRVISEFELSNEKNASVLIYDIIGVLGEKIKKEKEREKSFCEIMAEEGMEFIKRNIDNINIYDFINKKGITLKYLDNLFLRYYKKTTNELIYFYRMEFAKHAVFLTGEHRCRSYYKRCGFETEEIFEKEFKKYTGLDTKEYLCQTWTI